MTDCGGFTGSLHLRFLVEDAGEGDGCFRAMMGGLVLVSLHLRFLVEDAGEVLQQTAFPSVYAFL